MTCIEREGLEQLVSSATHMEERHIDQVFSFEPENRDVRNLEVKQQSYCYRDPEILFVYEVITGFVILI